MNNKNPTPKDRPDIYSPFIYPVKRTEKLDRLSKARDMEFTKVLFSRTSSRDFSRATLNELSELLYMGTKIRSIEIDDTNFFLTKRTTPSAGSRHPVDLMVSFPASPPVERILSYYNPIDHSLGELIIPVNSLHDFFEEVDRNLPIQDACVIWFSIQITKTSSKYSNPESLYWKDTGALLYCLQIIATYLGLRSCPLGTLAQNSFHNLFLNHNLISGGGILIGK